MEPSNVDEAGLSPPTPYEGDGMLKYCGLGKGDDNESGLMALLGADGSAFNKGRDSVL